jgi:flagellar assembly factor FliW
VEIRTSRFGILDLPEDRVIRVPLGLIGFPGKTEYVLIEHQKGSPFFWFQSAEKEDLAFVLIDPILVMADYEVKLSPDAMSLLKVEHDAGKVQPLQPMVIVNLSKEDPKEITANLLGPVVINYRERLAMQLALDPHRYSHRHPILQVPE